MKTAIIGMGVIGKVHLRVCQELGNKIVAVCEIDEKRTKEIASSVPVYSDYKKMLDEVEIQVVHICTPHYLHAEMIIECLRRNIHVLCEKPPCINPEELNEIVKAEEKTKAQLGVCLQNRYNISSLVAKEYLQIHKPTNGYGNVLWHRDKAYYACDKWRGKWATEGGGVIINQALHTLDLLQWFLGMPTECVATIENMLLKEVIEVEDTGFGLFSGESNFTIFATNGSVQEYPVEITLQTNEGLLKVTPDKAEINGQTLAIKDGDGYYGKCCYGEGHKSLIFDFYDCIRTGRKFSIDGVEAAKVMRLIFAMYKSKGRNVNI